MVYQAPRTEAEIEYPESDGKPMADNTKQFRWIVTIQQNLEWLFASDPNVFVAGDLLWYPVEGNNTISCAPDVMVVFGRPKGDRGSYKQWEEDNIAPQVVFEILSPSNTRAEMNRKLLFYHTYGVEEYYQYDPDRNELSGWQRVEGFLEVIEAIANWVSPRLGIRFVPSEPELEVYRPDGNRFLTYTEIAQRAESAEQRAKSAEQRAERLAQRLREMGIDPNQI
ncbi:Uma2 family endonuclease [Leptodesmis sichuanensis]|uniref:Uma2 family endonuclease n=1 Tax=Leptodesmis sichuanensis TaxID=2906798 RepID=UPI001F238AEC|nr:Uma2 family endonuclease [Leptodesmis sichuanensis]UIE38324.1 Uma2 family endonuclease [Leptodesmis sichuanensis A121]